MKKFALCFCLLLFANLFAMPQGMGQQLEVYDLGTLPAPKTLDRYTLAYEIVKVETIQGFVKAKNPRSNYRDFVPKSYHDYAATYENMRLISHVQIVNSYTILTTIESNQAYTVSFRNTKHGKNIEYYDYNDHYVYYANDVLKWDKKACIILTFIG